MYSINGHKTDIYDELLKKIKQWPAILELKKQFKNDNDQPQHSNNKKKKHLKGSSSH